MKRSSKSSSYLSTNSALVSEPKVALRLKAKLLTADERLRDSRLVETVW